MRRAFGDVRSTASMRPPHECGGKLRRGWTNRYRTSSFNEAPARMRGKTAGKLVFLKNNIELQ